MRVHHITTTDVITVRPQTSVREVATILVDRGISGVPVVDDQERPFGIVGEGALVLRIVAVEGHLGRLPGYAYSC